MARLNWLHISDVHIKEEDFDRGTVLTALLRDVQDRTSRIDADLRKIDLVFLTGDLVSGGREEEYELAFHELIEPLAQDLGIENLSQHVFLVPGNHDIDRGGVGVMGQAIRQMLSQETARERVRDLLLDDSELEMLLRPQAAYLEFFADTFDGIELLSPCKHYVHKVPLQDGKSAAVVGLNSAWLAYGGDEDRGRLILGEPQVVKALDRCSDTDFVVCLLHHPFDWFSPNNPDTTQCRSRLIERSHMILHGHLHTPNMVHASSLDGDTILIPAGAVFTTRNAPLSYNYVSLVLDSGMGTVFFRRYSDTRREWVKDVESTGDAADGKWSFCTRPPQVVGEVPVAQTAQLEFDGEEEGFLDRAVRVMDTGDALTKLMQKIGTIAETATNKMQISTRRLNETKGDFRRAQVVVLQMAAGIDEFAENTDESATEMETLWRSFYASFRPFLSLESDDLVRWLAIAEGGGSYAEKAIEVTATLETVSGQIDGLWISVSESRSSLVQLRGVHRSLNKAIRRADRAFDHFLGMLDQMKDDMTGLAQLSRTLPEVLGNVG